MKEPRVQIGETVLTDAQAASVRVAIAHFQTDLADAEFRRDLGPIADAYRDRLGEVSALVLQVTR